MRIKFWTDFVCANKLSALGCQQRVFSCTTLFSWGMEMTAVVFRQYRVWKGEVGVLNEGKLTAGQQQQQTLRMHTGGLMSLPVKVLRGFTIFKDLHTSAGPRCFLWAHIQTLICRHKPWVLSVNTKCTGLNVLNSLAFTFVLGSS